MPQFTSVRARPQLITCVPGQRSQSQLVNGTQTLWATLTFRGSLTKTAGDGTTIRNRGSLLAAIYRVFLWDGSDLWAVDPLALWAYEQFISPSAPSATRLATTADGVYDLEETVTLPFTSSYQLRRDDTAFMEKNPQANLFIQAQQYATVTTLGAERLVDGTATLGTVTCVVDQIHNPSQPGLPWFQTRVRQEVIPVTSALSEYPYFVKTDKYLRALIIQEVTNLGEDSTILSAFQFRSDAREIFGQGGMVDKIAYQRDCERRFGGQVFIAPSSPYTGLFFQEDGKLSKLLPPGDTNLRLVINAAPSVVGGATASYLNLIFFECERATMADPSTGRLICNPAPLPF